MAYAMNDKGFYQVSIKSIGLNDDGEVVAVDKVVEFSAPSNLREDDNAVEQFCKQFHKEALHIENVTLSNVVMQLTDLIDKGVEVKANTALKELYQGVTAENSKVYNTLPTSCKLVKTWAVITLANSTLIDSLPDAINVEGIAKRVRAYQGCEEDKKLEHRRYITNSFASLFESDIEVFKIKDTSITDKMLNEIEKVRVGKKATLKASAKKGIRGGKMSDKQIIEQLILHLLTLRFKWEEPKKSGKANKGVKFVVKLG